MTTTPFNLADVIPKVEEAARQAGYFDPDEWVAFLHPAAWRDLQVANRSDEHFAQMGSAGGQLLSGLEVRTNELCPRDQMMVVSRSVLDDGLSPEQARDMIGGVDGA